MKLFKWLLILLAISLVGCGEQSAGNALRLGTGGTGGMYYAYGTQLAKMIESEDKNHALDVKMTAGSAANLRLLREKFLDLAIVQSDTLSNAINGRGVFAAAGEGKGYAAVAGLYTEACQIVVTKNSGINNVSELVGKRVSVGERESGVLQNAEQILMAHGLTFEMIETVYMSFTDAASAMEKGQIDALFITAGTPTGAISQLAENKDIKILSIEPDVQNNMMKLYKGYTRCTIPANTYKGQTQPVETVGVKAVLVASTDLKDDDVTFITEFIFKNALPKGLTVENAVQDIPAGFHSGAAKFYEMQGVKVNVESSKSSMSQKAGQD